MIHVLTVHWKDDRWIDVQLRYLRRHVAEEYRVYAFLNHLPAHHRKKFFYASQEPVKAHPVKLNLLADVATAYADSGDDLLLFIDGDAFPVADVASWGREKLEEHPLLAVQRLENDGDRQPHPSFCLTTVGFWREIEGDWKPGHTWKNARGEEVTDVGGNLLGILEERETDWYPLRRTNTTDLHPLMFGVYDDVVYHHGAGFRPPAARIDIPLVRRRERTNPRYVLRKVLHPLVPSVLWGKELRKRLDPDKWVGWQVYERNQALSEKIFRQLDEDEKFFRQFLEPVGTDVHKPGLSARDVHGSGLPGSAGTGAAAPGEKRR